MKILKRRSLMYTVASFAIPAIIILAALAGLQITPFGVNSLAISDGNALYLNYLGYVGRAINGEEGILFSFTKGLGANMVGSWGWFLLNPFFFLFAFFDITRYMQVYTFVSLLNFCLCGLTMYILLKDIYGHRSSNLIFSTAYALNGFLVANVFQMNFFSVVPVLPLMVMGLRRVLRDKNPVLYILSVSYALFTNFYFGFMLCVASVLVFCVFFVANPQQIGRRKAVAVKYFVSSLLSGLLSSVVWLPALISLRGGRLEQSILNELTLKENMPFLDMFSKFFTGANSTAELRDGLPNIFVGILPLFLVILFFMNKRISKQQKVTAAILLLFYLISFYVSAINIAMHGGTVTNWFNYRDSFVFIFFMLMIAAEEWKYIYNESGKNLKYAAIILTVASMIVFQKQFEFVSGVMVLLDFAILSMMLLAFYMHRKNPIKNPQKVFTMVVVILMCLNSFLNYEICTKNILEWQKKESEYLSIVTPVGALVDGVKKSDSTFYRMEIGEQWSGIVGNDPMLYGYYGVGHGGSDDRNFVRTQLSKLGIRRYDMRNSYSKGIPAATDSLLGLKYIISKDNLEEEKGYERLIGVEEWSLYRNPFTLPISFLANQEINGEKLEFTDVFENLNAVWSNISGNGNDLFEEEDDVVFSSYNSFDPKELTRKEASKIIEAKDAEIASHTMSDETIQNRDSEESTPSEAPDSIVQSGSNDFEYMNEGSLEEPIDNSSYIKYTIAIHKDGPVYSYNRSGLMDDMGSILPVMIYEGYYHKGDTITKYLPVTTDAVPQNVLQDVAGRFRVAYANTDALDSMSKIVKNRPSEIEKKTDSYLRGTFTAEAGQELMFTIPYDEGWTLTVDGKETELKKVLGVFMAADVDPGKHVYEMKFMPTGLKAGATAAGVSLLLIIIYVLLDSKRRRKREGIADVQEGCANAINDYCSEKPEENAEQVIAPVVEIKEENAAEKTCEQ